MKALSTFFLAVCCTVSFGQSFLDPSFGIGGMASSIWDGDTLFTVTKIAIQSDGKILVSTSWNGYPAIMRYFSDGTVDTGFANHGVYSGPSHCWYNALVLQPDGKLVVGGGIYPDTDPLHEQFITLRFNTNGTLDSSFGTNGLVLTTFGSSGHHEARAASLQADGKIVLAGMAFSEDIGVARLKPDGSLDSTFGTNGVQSWALGLGANGVSILPDGRIALGATAYLNAFMAMRLLPDGTLDTSFNHTGHATTVAGDSYNYSHAMLLQPDGKIVLGGSGQFGASADMVVVRYDTTGALDHSFGDTGVIHIDINGHDDDISAMAFTADNKIQLAGITEVAGFDFALVRINGNGSVDSSFGDSGRIITNINGSDIARSVAIQPDGKIVVGGGSAGGYISVLARYLPVPLKTGGFATSSSTQLYPNPTSGILHIQSPMLHHILHITASDMAGRPFEVARLNEQDISLDGLPAGTYLLTLHFDDNTSVTQKIITRTMR